VAAGERVWVREGEIRVGMVADPGLPAEVAAALAEGELVRVLTANVTGLGQWRVDVVCEALPLDERGLVSMAELGARRRTREGWDVVIYLTDLPRRSGTRPVMADLSTGHSAALISLPAVGWVRLRPHVRDTIVWLVRRLIGEEIAPQRASGWFSIVRETGSSHPGIDVSLALAGWRGHARLLFGMVRDNRPWRLVPHLASATAAAAAATAFAIFYPSIWDMAEALPPWRLAVITAGAIVAMGGWLLVYNHLWERPTAHHTPIEAVLYNASTALTLLLGVAFMYGILYVLALVAAAMVIDAGYLRSQLGHPVGIVDYCTLVWLASSIGVVAGALGSSLDSEEAVRAAAYSRRERERQARHQSAAAGRDAPGPG
jgi:hypothetical protein